MNAREAADLLRPAVMGRSGAWADLGAGSGTFTRALVTLLAPGSLVYAVDRDASALARLRREVPGATPVRADFTDDVALPEVSFDGLVFSNSLHFVEDAGAVLERWSRLLRRGGRVVVIEYDGRKPSRWVPYPLQASVWPDLAAAAGLVQPAIRARRRSAFGGDLYVATADQST